MVMLEIGHDRNAACLLVMQNNMSQGPVSQTLEEFMIQILWRYVLFLGVQWWPDQAIILHMAQQQSCHDMQNCTQNWIINLKIRI